MWVGVEKGLFKKHGIDARVLQTRSGQIMMATLATGGASLVWAAPSSALNSSACGKGRQGKTGKFSKYEIRNSKQYQMTKNRMFETNPFSELSFEF
jgi:hypothetical protein